MPGQHSRFFVALRMTSSPFFQYASTLLVRALGVSVNAMNKLKSYFLGRRIPMLLYVALLLVTPFIVGAASAAPDTQNGKNNWQVGSLVNLSKGTQIREGPGLSFCYHTIVPEDNWQVKVIGGRRDADGRIWYDTSRKEAGDPSGGTGWVNTQQADGPAVFEGGERCPYSVQTTPTATPTSIKPAIHFQVPKFLIDVVTWWNGEPLFVKIGVMAVAVIFLLMSGRIAGPGNDAIVAFIRAVLLGVILGGVADLTRSSWIDSWHALAGGASGLDLALILLVAPFLWWALGLVLSAASKVVSIISLVIVALLLLAFVTPDRVNSILSFVQGLFKGSGK